MEEHARYGVNFIEAARKIKELLPDVKISGGVSNVSFAFRGNDTVREAFNAAFLYHAIHAGLDMGIVNAGQLAVYEDIEPALRERVEDVIFDRRPDATERLVAYGADARKARPRGGQGRSGLAARHGRRAAQALAGPRHRRVIDPTWKRPGGNTPPAWRSSKARSWPASRWSAICSATARCSCRRSSRAPG